MPQQSDAGTTAAFADPDRWRSAASLHAEGSQLRERMPVEALVRYQPDPDRADPIAVLRGTHADRVPELVPLLVGRMCASPFAFFRGAAAVFAADVATRAGSGLEGYLCGDAHAANFGLYASPERRQVFDTNDFDESVAGPFEWDLERLVASLVVAGRVAGAGDGSGQAAARACAGAYRAALAELATMPLLDAHYLITDKSTLKRHQIGDLAATFDRVRRKAKKNSGSRAAAKLTEPTTDGAFRFREEPPIMTRPPHHECEAVVTGLAGYADRLDPEVRRLLNRYAVQDVTHRIVGLGSVGYRNYLVLLRGNDDDLLILQVKQLHPSVWAQYRPGTAPPDGQRVFDGQRWMQTVSDLLLGWATIDGRPYLVRQFRNMKGSIDPTDLRADQLDDYARVAGVVLARGHAQSIDPRVLHGYADAGPGGAAFDDAFAGFALAYADQTEADHAALVAAVRDGGLPSETDT
ncbi:DUF2252 domain-containing protein [Actinoplanes sp. NPDC023801]|uniref:DUF2252 domain-containing protein n=1 Tax=Actinoplanes sp. NPDC023801 TaxID=3154595 RepID=UPI0033CDF35C